MTVHSNRVGAFFAVFAAIASAAPAQTLTTIVNFNVANGARPYGALVQGVDGNFYGTAGLGGLNNDGTVFKMTPEGTVTILHSFNSGDGRFPYAGLTLAPNGNFYGTTELGGVRDSGTVFQITATGALTSLYSFCSQSKCADGVNPYAPVTLDGTGNIYGAAYTGGKYNSGTVFKLAPGGSYTTLHSFTNTSGGAFPDGGLVRGAGGAFYGTTGGNTVFKISSSGAFETLYNFCANLGACTDGEDPKDALVEASDGNFYGTTAGGGNCFECGTVFRITPQGALTTIYSFCGGSSCSDGDTPYASLIQGTDGNLYGTTVYGGAYGAGTVFSITLDGKLTTLYSFDSTSHGYPYGALVQGTDGNFYGATSDFGMAAGGSIFKLSVGLGPFVTTLPSSGKVGAAIRILGNHLAQSTAVSFNGTAAAFQVHSATEILATVPAGATTGTLEVTTLSGTLSSNVAFEVKQ